MPGDIRLRLPRRCAKVVLKCEGQCASMPVRKLLHRQAASVGSMLVVVIAAIVEHSAGRMTHKRTHDTDHQCE